MRHTLFAPAMFFAALFPAALLPGNVPGLQILAPVSGQAQAASFAIDPDPNSPTLGDILDREAGVRAARPPKTGVSTSSRKVVTEPTIPAGAVTVLAPRVRPRVIPIHAQPGKPGSR